MNTAVESPENFGNSTIAPGSATLLKAPGEDEWNQVQGLLAFAQKLEKNSRKNMLLMGAVFSDLKRLYSTYTKALYKAGYRKDEVATYQQFKAESGFIIPSNATISNYTRVYACYVVSYQMAKLERNGHELSFAWIDPLLLAAPLEMLIYLFRENYHNTRERAREILTNAKLMKRSDFWLWLERQPRVTPPSPPAHLIDDNKPSDKPFQDSIEKIYEPYEIADPSFDWNKVIKGVKIPKDIKRPIRITVLFSEVEYGKGSD